MAPYYTVAMNIIILVGSMMLRGVFRFISVLLTPVLVFHSLYTYPFYHFYIQVLAYSAE